LNTSPQESQREPLEVERLLPAAKRVTVGEFQAWRESIATPAHQVDELDELLEEIRQVETEARQ
jgi:hypothetical protein